MREGLKLRPLKCGGSGVQTYLKKHPDDMPTALEAGTLNGHGIAGLGAAIEYLEKEGIDNIREKELQHMWHFYNGIKDIPGVKVYGDFETEIRCPIVTLNIGDYDSSEVSDELLITAQGLEIIRRKAPTKLRQTLARIDELVGEYGVGKIVLGYPKNMNNTEGERCEKTQEFKEMLEKRTGLEVVLWDERLTTVSADNAMMEMGIRRENRKEYVDEIAAIFILQGYLDFLANQKNA